jgi:hypothetical protein
MIPLLKKVQPRKPHTIDRENAIARGLARKHPKLSHCASKAHIKGRQFATPSDKDIFLAHKYRRTLSHLQ